MTKEEMMAGLREAAAWFGTDGDTYHPVYEHAVRAAITALEAAPSQVEAPPSVHPSSLTTIIDVLETDAASLRAELEQARGERAAIQRALYDATAQAKRAEQERDAALAEFQREKEHAGRLRAYCDDYRAERDAALAKVARVRELEAEVLTAAAAEARGKALREADEAIYELAGEYAASTGTVGRAHVRALSKAVDAIRALRGGGR